MDIAIIGHGKVGSTLARGWAEHGHHITIGARNPEDEKAKALSESSDHIRVAGIKEAVTDREVMVVAIPAPAVPELGRLIRNRAAGKVIIDASNAVFEKPAGFRTGAEALKSITGCKDVVKGFNTTGYENMADPVYNGEGIDMFTAGDSSRGKQAVERLAKDLGFAACYDFGGDDKFELIEQFAMSWINLAIIQGEGRDIAFKLIRR